MPDTQEELVVIVGVTAGSPLGGEPSRGVSSYWCLLWLFETLSEASEVCIWGSFCCCFVFNLRGDYIYFFNILILGFVYSSCVKGIST